MAYEPQKYFIGVSDFFSVLLPGTLVTYAARPLLGWFVSAGASTEAFPLSTTENAGIFLFISFVAGHFIFIARSFVVDAYMYGPIHRMRSSYAESCALCRVPGSKPNEEQTGPLAWLARRKMLMGIDPCAPHVEVLALRQEDGNLHSANNFQWSQAWLHHHLPSGLLAVDRMQAQSKFFRSLILVWPLLAIRLLLGVASQAQFGLKASYICAGAALLSTASFLRYANQRSKAIALAYRLVIAGHRPKPAG